MLVFMITFGLSAFATPKHPVIVISFDGFRQDYTDHIYTPGFDRLAGEGFAAERMIPAWPSLTFPNHYTLATGLHPANHGIVNNSFYDRETGKTYDRKTDYGTAVVQPEWYQGKAIWEVAKSGGLMSATYFWVGSEVRGRTPDRHFPYKSKEPHQKRFEVLEQWLARNKGPSPDLMMFYFEDVDLRGHYDGVATPELIAAVKEADAIVSQFLQIIEASGREANLIIVSDHGMAPLSDEYISTQAIEDAVGDDLELLTTHYTTIDLFIKNPDAEKVAGILARLPQKPWLHWYPRDQFPWPLHPNRNGDIYGYTDPGFQVMEPGKSVIAGGHGFDPELPDMGAICFARGPAFRPQSRLESVRSVDIFPLMLELLDLPQMETDGDLSVWKSILIEAED